MCVAMAASVMAQNNLTTGYRGFVDGMAGLVVGDSEASTNFEFSTTHGYQFNNKLFVGAGVGVLFYNRNLVIDQEAKTVTEDETRKLGFPIYGEVRYDFMDNRFTPFVSGRIGYTVGQLHGLYYVPAVGIRFAVGEKMGINLALIYTSQKWKSTRVYDNETKHRTSGIGLRVGIDW